MNISHTHFHSAIESVINLKFSLLVKYYYEKTLVKQVSWLHVLQICHQNKMGAKNQAIVAQRKITAQIHFWIINISVTNQWKLQGCVPMCKAKALSAYQLE